MLTGMKTVLLLSISFFTALTHAFSQSPPYGVDDPIMGAYEGSWMDEDRKRSRFSAQIRALGDGRYDGFFLLDRGGRTTASFAVKSTEPASGGNVNLIGESGSTAAPGELVARLQFRGRIEGGKFSGKVTGANPAEIQADRVQRKPMSLGAAPPTKALVLFDGKDLGKWDNASWVITPEGSLRVGKGDLHTKEKLENFRLHLEFRTPFMPKATGQARGNSGVYLQRRHEVQVLDSFGLYPLRIDDCSSIYNIKTTSANACLPPMQWQTYDITYLAADAKQGNKPTISVLHNGVKVVDAAVIPDANMQKGTGGGNPTAEPGFLHLQDHGDPVEYRNIWALPL